MREKEITQNQLEFGLRVTELKESELKDFSISVRRKSQSEAKITFRLLKQVNESLC